MEKTCAEYTSEEISRFIDNELPEDQHPAVAQHLIHCQNCSRLVERYRSVSAVINDHADKQVLKIDPAGLKQKTERAIKKLQTKSLGNIFGFFGKNIYLKLASIAAIVMFGLLPFQGALFGPTGPSAIVKSVDTDFASVMIIETQKEKHTIIWFSET